MSSVQDVEHQVATLQRQIQDTEAQLRKLKLQLEQAQAQARAAHELSIAYQGGMPLGWQAETLAVLSQLTPVSQSATAATTHFTERDRPLAADEYQRYGRQLIMPEIGLQGQLRLKNAKVLLVGAGGLGCPAAAYLAGAGVGTLGLVDGDVVELSNLHRQVAHSTPRIGVAKVKSAIEYLQSLNPSVRYIAHSSHLVARDALTIIAPYDLVLDCTDHPTSRYLISDACVLLGKPLVSASALRTEGQLMLLNSPAKPPGDNTGGPCYRCVFPKPPPAESVISCGEGGILGPVVGVMGVLQALEAIKSITRGLSEHTPPSLLMFSAYNSPPFRSVRLRSRRRDCAVCSANVSITEASLMSGSVDYTAFCGVTSPVTVLADDERIGAKDFATKAQNIPDVALVDVREATQFELCNLPGSINVPWSDLPHLVGQAQDEKPSWLQRDNVVFVCKLGNDSQLAAKLIKDSGHAAGNVMDIKGGFKAWKAEVDPSWPEY